MKVLLIVLFSGCCISCNGQNKTENNENKTNDSSGFVKLKLVPLEAGKPTTIDSIVLPDPKLVHLKLYSDGKIGYKLHMDSAYKTIFKDQIKPLLDKYPDRNVAIKGDRDANYELFKEVVGIIKTREKKKFYLITE